MIYAILLVTTTTALQNHVNDFEKHYWKNTKVINMQQLYTDWQQEEASNTN